ALQQPGICRQTVPVFAGRALGDRMSEHRAVPRINAIATAVPATECDGHYHAWAHRQLEGKREAALLDRMLQRSGIGSRFTVLSDRDTHETEGSFYAGSPPTTLD